MHVTQFERLSSSVDIIKLVLALFSAFLTSNTFIIPIRLPVKIYVAEQKLQIQSNIRHIHGIVSELPHYD